MKTIKTTIPLALFAASAGAIFAQDNPLYWVAQDADKLLSYEVFSPTGDYADALTAEPADWSVYDIIFDARYSGANADGYGVNNFVGISGDWSVKSVTVADNWDDSQATWNKDKLWWATNDATAEPQKGYTWNIAEDFNIKSALGGWNKNVSLNIGGNLNVDISQKTLDGSKDRGNRDVYLVNLSSLNIGNDFTVDNGGIISLQSNKDIKIGGNLSVSNAAQFNFAEAGLGAESLEAGFSVQGSVNISNVGEVHSWYTNRIYVDGDFTASDVSLLQLDYSGATREGIYTDAGKNGICINGNMSLTRIGRGDGDFFYGWNSSFFRVGKSLNIIEMKSHMKFGAIGVLNGQDGGGIEIGENLFVDNRAGDKYEVQFQDSNYMTVGKNVTLYNTNLGAWNMKRIEIGGDLHIADGANAYFERTRDYIKIMGSLTAEGAAAFESRDSGYMYVGEDFNIGTADVKVGSHKGKDGADASLSNVGLEIGGKINMGGGKLGLFYASGNVAAPTADSELFVSASGLNGSGILYTAVEHNTEFNYKTTLILNNTSDSVYQGAITYYSANGSVDPEKMKFDIIKNGSASQTIILNESSSPSAADYSRWIGKIKINEGLMALYTGDASAVKVDLELNGGSLAVAYNKTGGYNPETDTMGVLRAGTVEINRDAQIIFDVANNPYVGYENDLIEADVMSGEGIVTIVVELDAGTFSEGDILDDVVFDLFRVAENNYDWANALVRVMYKGTDITDTLSKIEAAFNGDTSGSFSVTLSGEVIPEPASVAAVLGALVLGFAAYRRRK